MKLDEVIRTYIANTGNTTLHGYIKYLHYARQALRKAKVNLGLDLLTVDIAIDSKKQGVLPDDYLQWSKVTVLAGDRLIKLVYDETIIDPSFNERQPYNLTFEDNTPIEDEFSFLASQIKPDNVHEVLGRGSGYFKVDKKASLIQFDARLSIDMAYLTYISNRFKPNSETEVHPFMADALVKYIHWQEAVYNPFFGEAHPETRARKQEYLNMIDQAQANFMNLTSELLIDIQNRSTSRSPIKNL